MLPRASNSFRHVPIIDYRSSHTSRCRRELMRIRCQQKQGETVLVIQKADSTPSHINNGRFSVRRRSKT